MRSINAIKKDIETAEKAHKAAFSEDQKKEMQELIDELKVELAESEAKGAKKAEPKAKAPKAEKKKPEHKHKEPEHKHEENKKHIITVNGKEYNIEDCKEAILALHARKHQAKKAANKYKTKKPVVKAAEDAKALIGKIEESIPDKKIEANPKQVISVLKEFKTKMESAFAVLGKIISASDLAILKKSLKEIDEIVAKYGK